MSSGRGFGTTWWGRAWIEALEQRAQLDPSRLPRGQAYAREDRVHSLVARPGEVLAEVQGNRAEPYEVRLAVRQFSDDEWDRVIDAVAARAGHAAALLDGELVPEILDDVAGAGIDLLPATGELEVACSCPDEVDPCKHAAAVCYLVADLLDQDPFVAFHLRGRSRDELLAALRARRSSRGRRRTKGRGTARPASTRMPGPIARDAFARRTDEEDDDDTDTDDADADDRDDTDDRDDGDRRAKAREAAVVEGLWRLDRAFTADKPGSPMPVAIEPPGPSGVLSADLLRLAADATNRAFGLARGTGESELRLSVPADLGRLAAARLDTRSFALLATRSGLPGRQLVRMAVAWQNGDAEGVEVSEQGDEDGPDMPPEVMEAGRVALAERLVVTDMARRDRPMTAARAAARVRITGNRVTAGRVQLRLAPSGRWYRFARIDGAWEMDGPPSREPADIAGSR